MSERETYLAVMTMICHDRDFWGEKSLFDELIAKGWLKEKRTIRMDPIEGLMPASFYCLTAAGHLELARPLINVEPVPLVIAGISHQERSNFDVSGKKGLHTCWHMHKRKERGNVRISLILSAIEARSMAPDFTTDGLQIMILAEYLEGARS